MEYQKLSKVVNKGELWLSFILFFTLNHLSAQTWEKEFTTVESEIFPCVAEWNRSYILGFGPTQAQVQTYSLFFLDPHGNIHDSITNISIPGYQQTNFTKLTIIGDTLYSMGRASNDQFGISDLAFIKVNLITKDYVTLVFQSADTAEYIFDYVSTPNGFIVPGWEIVNGLNNGYILEVSQNGDYVKKQNTGSIESLTGYLWSDNLTLSTRFISVETYVFQRSTFQPIDTVVTSAHSFSLGGSLTSRFNSAYHLVGSVISDQQINKQQCEVLGIVNDSTLFNSFRFGRPEKEGKVQGVQPIAESDSNIYFMIGSVSEDVDPIFRADPTEIALFKTNQNGDTLFMKFYKGEVKYIANSIIATSDGGALIASSKYDWNSPYPNQWDIHLLKVDSLGNYTPLGEKELPTTSSEILVFPNPASDFVTLSGFDSFPVELSFYDLLGREVLTRKIYEDNQKIDVSTLSSGTYVYKTNSNAVGKIIVNRSN